MNELVMFVALFYSYFSLLSKSRMNCNKFLAVTFTFKSIEIVPMQIFIIRLNIAFRFGVVLSYGNPDSLENTFEIARW